MSRFFDPSDWSPVRAGTAIGRIFAAILPFRPDARSGQRRLLAQQPWHIRYELLAACVIWSALPVSMAAALIGRSIRSGAARTILILLVPPATLVLVQCSMLVVGTAMWLLRRTGIRRRTEDGRIQALVWGAAGALIAVPAIRSTGLPHWLAVAWLSILGIEGGCRILAAIVWGRLAAVSRSRESGL